MNQKDTGQIFREPEICPTNRYQALDEARAKSWWQFCREDKIIFRRYNHTTRFGPLRKIRHTGILICIAPCSGHRNEECDLKG
jgi:hypothetical protein